MTRHLSLVLVLFLGLGDRTGARPHRISPEDPFRTGFDLLLEDRLPAARDIARKILERDPDDPGGLVLRAAVEMYLLDYEESRTLLVRAQELAPEFPAVGLRLGDLEMLEGQFKEAESIYQRTLARHPDHILLRLNLAISQLQDQRRKQGEATFREALEKPDWSREALMTRGLVFYLLGDHEACIRSTREYEARWGPCASTRFLLGMVALRKMDLDRARTLLQEVARHAAAVPSMLQQIANLHLALGDVPAALKLLIEAVARFPEVRPLADQLEGIEARHRSESNLRSLSSPPFSILYDQALSRELVDRILELSRRHLATLSKIFDRRPSRVEMRVYSTTGFSAPAYYNNLPGEIIVSGEVFRDAERNARGFVDHALGHELAHLMIWGQKGLTRSVNSLWLDEGLAEYLSGGVGYLENLGTDLRGLFTDGPMSMSDLIGNINVLWNTRNNSLKAYVQSYFMVTYLMRLGDRKGDGLGKILDLLRRVSSDVPLEVGLKEIYDLDMRAFDEGWTRYLRDSLDP